VTNITDIFIIGNNRGVQVRHLDQPLMRKMTKSEMP